MAFSIKFNTKPNPKSDTLIFLINEGNKLSTGAKKADKKYALSATLKNNAQFTGKSGQTLALNNAKSKIILLGTGDAAQSDGLAFETMAGKLFTHLKSAGTAHVTINMDGIKTASGLKKEDAAAHFGMGLQLAAYNFEHYKSKKDKTAKTLKSVTITSEKDNDAKKLHKAYMAIADGVCLARDLVNEPPNMLYPKSYVQRIKDELKPLGVDITILGEKQMEKLGFGALLAVGQGSACESQVAIMRWDGDTKTKKAPIALVGKGVTFDTGGISLKPGPNMDQMKMDMGGSAAVVGTIKALAGRKAKVNAIGIVGLVENMPSSNAYRPGDVITSHAGKTIEVLNTDAEGRLVLADILTYVQQKYKPEVIIDLATLTGAIMVALGLEYCGAFANDNDLWKQIEKSSHNTGEKFWRMPLDEAYRKEMESDVADLKNLGTSYGGSCSAAGFLEHFIDDGVKWAHIDIAGTAWWKTDKPTTPKGGTGFGVRALDDLIQNNFEK